MYAKDEEIEEFEALLSDLDHEISDVLSWKPVPSTQMYDMFKKRMSIDSISDAVAVHVSHPEPIPDVTEVTINSNGLSSLSQSSASTDVTTPIHVDPVVKKEPKKSITTTTPTTPAVSKPIRTTHAAKRVVGARKAAAPVACTAPISNSVHLPNTVAIPQTTKAITASPSKKPAIEVPKVPAREPAQQDPKQQLRKAKPTTMESKPIQSASEPKQEASSPVVVELNTKPNPAVTRATKASTLMKAAAPTAPSSASPKKSQEAPVPSVAKAPKPVIPLLETAKVHRLSIPMKKKTQPLAAKEPVATKMQEVSKTHSKPALSAQAKRGTGPEVKIDSTKARVGRDRGVKTKPMGLARAAAPTASAAAKAKAPPKPAPKISKTSKPKRLVGHVNKKQVSSKAVPSYMRPTACTPLDRERFDASSAKTSAKTSSASPTSVKDASLPNAIPSYMRATASTPPKKEKFIPPPPPLEDGVEVSKEEVMDAVKKMIVEKEGNGSFPKERVYDAPSLSKVESFKTTTGSIASSNNIPNTSLGNYGRLGTGNVAKPPKKQLSSLCNGDTYKGVFVSGVPKLEGSTARSTTTRENRSFGTDDFKVFDISTPTPPPTPGLAVHSEPKSKPDAVPVLFAKQLYSARLALNSKNGSVGSYAGSVQGSYAGSMQGSVRDDVQDSVQESIATSVRDKSLKKKRPSNAKRHAPLMRGVVPAASRVSPVAYMSKLQNRRNTAKEAKLLTKERHAPPVKQAPHSPPRTGKASKPPPRASESKMLTLDEARKMLTLDEARKARRMQRDALSTPTGMKKLARLEGAKQWAPGEGRTVQRLSQDFKGARRARLNSSPIVGL